MSKRSWALFVLVFLAVSGLGAAYAFREEPAWYVRLRYPLQYEAIIRAHAHHYSLDPALVAAVIYTESKFNPDRRSSAGAIGLMQLLPTTAQGIADYTGGQGFTPADLYVPELNVRYGCWYLHHLIRKYARYPDPISLALAAYNAGQGNVDSWIRDARPGASIAIPIAETRAYVASVQHLRTLYARGYGL